MTHGLSGHYSLPHSSLSCCLDLLPHSSPSCCLNRQSSHSDKRLSASELTSLVRVFSEVEATSEHILQNSRGSSTSCFLYFFLACMSCPGGLSQVAGSASHMVPCGENSTSCFQDGFYPLLFSSGYLSRKRAGSTSCMVGIAG